MLHLEDTKVEVQYNNGGVRMERIPNAVSTKELREEAVKLVWYSISLKKEQEAPCF